MDIILINLYNTHLNIKIVPVSHLQFKFYFT